LRKIEMKLSSVFSCQISPVFNVLKIYAGPSSMTLGNISWSIILQIWTALTFIGVLQQL